MAGVGAEPVADVDQRARAAGGERPAPGEPRRRLELARAQRLGALRVEPLGELRPLEQQQPGRGAAELAGDRDADRPDAAPARA